MQSPITTATNDTTKMKMMKRKIIRTKEIFEIDV